MELELVGELSEEPARTIKSAAGSFQVTAGQSLKIESSPQGEEILDEMCPAGKTWMVRVELSVIEQDA